MTTSGRGSYFGSAPHQQTFQENQPTSQLDEHQVRQAFGPVRDEAFERLLEDARKKLVETGTRNRLIHINRSNQRANALNIVNEQSDDVFDILKRQGKRMKFLATGRDKDDADNDQTPRLEMISDDGSFDEARYTDNQLESLLGPDALQKRLLRLARDAKTAEEEQGINILFLALGFLSWFEDKNSDVKREAPLILIPVELVRNLRTSTYDLRCRDEDIVANLPLQERLNQDFGIDIPEIESEEEDWKPSGYFDQIETVVASRERWAIDRDGMQLGFFSFAKLLMLHDLDAEKWGENGLQASPLIEGLLRSGFRSQPAMFGKDDKLDEILEPARIIQVVDADASQTKVIEEVRAGRNLVVQGPPGTGKSQTITNIIAAAVHDGKRVLFVAEKMAALSVVHNRLKKVGLESVCLELHSRTANKKSVIGEISRTLSAGAAIPQMPGSPDDLKQRRDELNAIDKLLHSSLPNLDHTAYEAISALSSLAGVGAPPPTLRRASLPNVTKQQLSDVMSAIDSYGEIRTQVGPRRDHPFFGVRNLTLQPLDVQRLIQHIGKAIGPLEALAETLSAYAKALDVESRSFADCQRLGSILELASKAPAHTLTYLAIAAAMVRQRHFRVALQIAKDWQSSKQSATDFLDAAWQTPTAQMRSGIANGVGSFLARIGGRYRSASRELSSLLRQPLPKAAEDRLDLLDELIELQGKRERYVSEKAFLQGALGSVWREEHTPFAEIQDVVDWYTELSAVHPGVDLSGLESLLASPGACARRAEAFNKLLVGTVAAIGAVEKVLELEPSDAYGSETTRDAGLSSVLLRLQAVVDNQERYGEWCKQQHFAANLVNLGFGELVGRIDAGDLDENSAKDELRYAHAEAVWAYARKAVPALDKFRQMNRDLIVDNFQEREAERIEDVRDLVLARHLTQLPTGSIGEMGVIRGEIGKKRAHKPIRKLFEQAGVVLQRIKPVLLMSPISVAQFLPPGSIDFDLLVIDEASQVRPEDALGAIARANQIVVVGDQKQLPPTSFFDRVTGNDPDEEDDELLDGAAKATEMESILSLCEARGIPSRMLEWHYRSRDPSLITVSNVEFYGGNLVLPPSPLQHDAGFGIRFVPVKGAYTSKSRGDGRPGTNKIEAQAIVEAVASHAVQHPELSLGVVAFSATQRNMVTELLELERRKNARLDEFLREGKPEDFFAKNIENVQGDERDVILISVGYGPYEPGGRLHSMSFGPVNSDGGERRLNVLFSRARVRCDVFASFEPGDIDLSRTSKDGPRILKRYLEYAKTGQLGQSLPTSGSADSPFEEDVASEIRKLGFSVDHQVGSAGFLIDLGVKHPVRSGQYMIAVECDGATYHSALWARERDRLRQEILEHLGWRFHRIWSTDWFYQRGPQVERLRCALETAARMSENGIEVTGANSNYELPAEEDLEEAPTNTVSIAHIPATSIRPDPYKLANIRVDSDVEPHEAPLRSAIELVLQIVDGEGPIHQEEVARRFAAAFGKERAGRRIQDKTAQALRKAKGMVSNADTHAMVKSQGPFWFTDLQEQDPKIRDRSEQSPSIQRAEMLPPLEIAAAVKLVVEESGNVPSEEIVRAVAKAFGFDRVGPSLKNAIEKVVKASGVVSD